MKIRTNNIISRTTLAAITATGFALAASSASAAVVLAYDSRTDSTSQLTGIASVTDSDFVSASDAFSSLGAEVAGGFVHGSQSNVAGPNSNQNDLNFRFGSTPEVVLGNTAVAASLSSGNYVEFGFTAAKDLTLNEFSFHLFVNSQNGSLYAARDAGLFVDVNGGGFSQFGLTHDSAGTGNRGIITFSELFNVSSGEVVTYRLALADKTSLVSNLQAATRIGNVQISAFNSVPEPSSVILGGCGVLIMMGMRRRRLPEA